ncbi:hypothetical protein [Streptomyces sp. NPDC096033]|uniref:hypothetical protein n=1 Tax=Streptomyces sp. NPDC096033 TaxID=3366071 RepID=UPI0038084084
MHDRTTGSGDTRVRRRPEPVHRCFAPTRAGECRPEPPTTTPADPEHGPRSGGRADAGVDPASWTRDTRWTATAPRG